MSSSPSKDFGNFSESSQKSPVEISIVVVSWNAVSLLDACLRSIFDSLVSPSFEVLVVDNNSTDGTPDFVAARFPAVRLIRNSANTGFAAATNQGISASRGDFVLLLNSDTIVNGESLNAMLALIKSKPAVGAVGGRLLNPDGTFQAAYADFPNLAQEVAIATGIGERLWRGYPAHRDSASAGTVDWISAACLMVRRKALDEVGLLDEEYFMYSEEVDLQYRLACAGWSVFYLPDAFTIHVGGGSQDRWRRRRMVYRGKMLFYRKNYGSARAAALRVALGTVSLAKLGFWTVLRAVAPVRHRAALELRSTLEVLDLCLRLR